jgi:hypothetical protein
MGASVKKKSPATLNRREALQAPGAFFAERHSPRGPDKSLAERAVGGRSVASTSVVDLKRFGHYRRFCGFDTPANANRSVF